MTPSPKFRFASDEWLAAAQATIDAVIATSSLDLAGLSVRFSEVFTNAPADLPGRRANGTPALTLELASGAAIVIVDECDDVDFKLFADYAGFLPLVRRASYDPPDPSFEAHRNRMIADGQLRVVGEPASLPAPIQKLIEVIHDRLAKITA